MFPITPTDDVSRWLPAALPDRSDGTSLLYWSSYARQRPIPPEDPCHPSRGIKGYLYHKKAYFHSFLKSFWICRGSLLSLIIPEYFFVSTPLLDLIDKRSNILFMLSFFDPYLRVVIITFQSYPILSEVQSTTPANLSSCIFPGPISSRPHGV